MNFNSSIRSLRETENFLLFRITNGKKSGILIKVLTTNFYRHRNIEIVFYLFFID